MLGAVSLGSLLTFSRASTASMFDNTGTLQQVASNVARFDYDPVALTPRGLLVEETRTNYIRNPRCEGAAIGAPGVAPTNWSITSGNGVNQQVVGTGFESGIPYVDIRWYGTTTATTNCTVSFELNTAIAAGQGQQVVFSGYARLIGGAVGAPIQGMQWIVQEVSSSSSFLAQSALVWSGVPTSAALVTQRPAQVYTTTQSTCAYVKPLFLVQYGSGVAIDFTLRFGAPQLEFGAFVSTPILPPVGIPGATTRSVDYPQIPSGPWFSPTAGTIQVEAMIPYGVSLNNGCIFALSGTSGFAVNAIDVQNQYTTNSVDLLTVSNNNSLNLGGSAASISNGNVFKTAISYSADTAIRYTGATNGVVADYPGAYATPLGFDNVGGAVLSLGFGRNSPLNGYIRRARYWPRVFTSAELAAITT